MALQDRQCFFLTENRPYIGEKSLPRRNTRNYMNKMMITENDQFEICGFFAIHFGTMNKYRKEENKHIAKQIISKLSDASGIVDILISGFSLCKYVFIYDEPVGMDLIY